MRPRKQTDGEAEQTIRDGGQCCDPGDVSKFRNQGRPLCVTVSMKNGESHIFPVEIALAALDQYFRSGNQPPVLLEMEDVWGRKIDLNTGDAQCRFWAAITRTHCSQCGRQLSQEEMRKCGGTCPECLYSTTCSCGKPKEAGRIDCDDCFHGIMGGFVAGVADAFGGKAIEVDLAESLVAGKWKERTRQTVAHPAARV